jgi:hypothetical protein
MIMSSCGLDRNVLPTDPLESRSHHESFGAARHGGHTPARPIAEPSTIRALFAIQSSRNAPFTLSIPGDIGPVAPVRTAEVPRCGTPQAISGGQRHTFFAPLIEPVLFEVRMIHVPI